MCRHFSFFLLKKSTDSCPVSDQIELLLLSIQGTRMKGRITYLLFMFTINQIVVPTVCNARKRFTCGKYAHCTIVMTKEKCIAIKIIRSSKRPVCFPNADHVMFSREIFSCLFRIYAYI